MAIPVTYQGLGRMNLPAPTAVIGEIVTASTVTYPAAKHPALSYLRSLRSAASVPTMRRALDEIARTLTGGRCDHLNLPWHKLRYEHTSALAANLAGRYAPATANKMLSALSRVVQECWRLGYYDAETRDRTRDFARADGTRLTGAAAGRALKEDELRALFASCAEDGPLGIRDAALLAVLYNTGVRREEAVRLDVEHFDPAERKLTVLGKRNKERTAYLGDAAQEALNAWLNVRGRQPGPLFVPVHRSGHVSKTLRRLSPAGIYQALDRRSRRLSLEKFSPHDLRRTLIGDLLDSGADVVTVSKIAGHASLKTTAGYDRRDERAKKRAASLVTVPFVGTRVREDGQHAA